MNIVVPNPLPARILLHEPRILLQLSPETLPAHSRLAITKRLVEFISVATAEAFVFGGGGGDGLEIHAGAITIL